MIAPITMPRLAGDRRWKHAETAPDYNATAAPPPSPAEAFVHSFEALTEVQLALADSKQHMFASLNEGQFAKSDNIPTLYSSHN